jgi:hypothetical protein
MPRTARHSVVKNLVNNADKVADYDPGDMPVKATGRWGSLGSDGQRLMLGKFDFGKQEHSQDQ